MNAQPEYNELHVPFYDWCCWNPRLEPYIFAIEHGEKRDPRIGRKLKRKGVKKGMADYLYAKSNKKYRQLWIEFKHGKNKQSESQKTFQKLMESLGDAYIVCYTINEAANALELYEKDKL
jgi:hypothetical protein